MWKFLPLKITMKKGSVHGTPTTLRWQSQNVLHFVAVKIKFLWLYTRHQWCKMMIHKCLNSQFSAYYWVNYWVNIRKYWTGELGSNSRHSKDECETDDDWCDTALICHLWRPFIGWFRAWGRAWLRLVDFIFTSPQWELENHLKLAKRFSRTTPVSPAFTKILLSHKQFNFMTILNNIFLKFQSTNPDCLFLLKGLKASLCWV